MNTKKWIFGGNGYNDRRFFDSSRNIQGSVDDKDDERRPTNPQLKLCFQLFCDFHQENREFTVSRCNIGFPFFPYLTESVKRAGCRPVSPGSADRTDSTILKQCQPIWTPAYLAVIEVVEIVGMDFLKRVRTILILYLA